MNLKNAIKKNTTTLIILDETTYHPSLKTILALTTKELCCYVTFNKTCRALLEFLQKNHLSAKNIKFIDAITRTIKDTESTKDCTYISSPESLTELAIVLKKHLEFPFKYLIFDSATNLLTYADVNNIKKFIKSIAFQASETNCKLILLAVETPDNKPLLKTLGTFVDNTIQVTK